MVIGPATAIIIVLVVRLLTHDPTPSLSSEAQKPDENPLVVAVDTALDKMELSEAGEPQEDAPIQPAESNIPMVKLQKGSKPPQFVIFSFDGGAGHDDWARFLDAAEGHGARFVTQVEDLNKTYVRGHVIGTHYNGHFCAGNEPSGDDLSTADWDVELDHFFAMMTDWKQMNGYTEEVLDLRVPKEAVRGGRRGHNSSSAPRAKHVAAGRPSWNCGASGRQLENCGIRLAADSELSCGGGGSTLAGGSWGMGESTFTLGAEAHNACPRSDRRRPGNAIWQVRHRS
ncbi:MAG: hypothetical protein WA892_00675 [Ornithinimicrobium sp.]